MEGAVLEIGDAGAEDKVRGALYVAVQEIIALDAAFLSKAAIGVQGVLIAQETAAVEEEEIPVREYGYGLADLLPFSGGILKSEVFEGDIAGVDINGGAAGSAHGEIPAGPELLGIFVISEDGALSVLSLEMDAEFGVRDGHFLLVDTLPDKDSGDFLVAVVRDGVHRFLYGHIIPVTIGRYHYVVMHQMGGKLRDLGTDALANHLRYLAGACSHGMGVVVLPGGNHEIGP